MNRPGYCKNCGGRLATASTIGDPPRFGIDRLGRRSRNRQTPADPFRPARYRYRRSPGPPPKPAAACRAWSAITRHQSRPRPGEQMLGVWAAQQLRKCGGVLEQPAFSHLWEAVGFPRPGQPPAGGVWSLELWQSWFGHPCQKKTWLAFCGVDRSAVEIPLRLDNRGGSRRRFQLLSNAQRSATPPAFAHWLVEIARTARVVPTEVN